MSVYFRTCASFFLAAFAAQAFAAPVHADDSATDLPANLGGGVAQLVRSARAMDVANRGASAAQTRPDGTTRAKLLRAQTDAAGRVVVDVRLDGTVAVSTVRRTLTDLGLTVIGEHVSARPDGRGGILSAYLPLDKAVEVAHTPGVLSAVLVHKPRPRVGKVTSAGAAALHTDAVNARGYTGQGITVGVLSDSYDQVSPHAPADVASGDLPSGVVVLQDGHDPDYDTDEGRAMLQIVHDVAPDASLVFSTTGDTQSTFADAIRALRAAGCDILVDDIGFSDEPFFSDSIVSEAVDDVVTSASLPGRPVIFYSASGNDGSVSYAASFDAVSDAAARAGTGSGNLHLDEVPAALTAGGFQNFKGADTGRGNKIVQKLVVQDDDAELDFQWDDPFDADLITSDYNILVFDAAGNYLPDDSGIDNNFSTGEALEYAELPLNADGSRTVYQIAIARAATRQQPAARLRYFASTDGTVSGKYLHTGQPTLFGHGGARNADGIAAYDVHALSQPESSDSFGPVTILFDASGNRLTTPEVRQQPTLSAVDGVNTTFFPAGALSETDTDGDGFPNFYGTSAAAPHAAGAAALLLQAAGGSGSYSAAQMRALLEATAASHDLDPGFSRASLVSADGTITASLSAAGDGSQSAAFDDQFFNLGFSGPAGTSLVKAVINLAPAGEHFDDSPTGGYPFTVGAAKGAAAGAVTAGLAGGSGVTISPSLSLTAAAGAFPSGAVLQFGIGRDAADGSPSESADLLAGSTVKLKIKLPGGGKANLKGSFANTLGTGYSPDVGWGLINAEAALDQLLGQ